MDEVSQEPGRDFRVPPGWRRWVTVVGVGGLVAAVVVFGPFRVGGHAAGGAARVPVATASPGPAGPPGPPGSQGSQAVIFATAGASWGSAELVVAPPLPGPAVAYRTGAPGTVLLSCGSAIPGQQGGDWQRWSLHVGPLWFPLSQAMGYVRAGLPPRTNRAPAGSAASTAVQMIVLVAGDSRVVLKPAAGTAAYFRFLIGVGNGVAHPLPPGATGYTFAACPGSTGAMTEFLIGFSIQPGRMVPVQVQTSGSARPVWLTFSAPTGQLFVSTSVGGTVGTGG
jgi:hypothetical protein